MRNKPFHFRILKTDVFVPTSGWIGLLLISYFAVPTSLSLLGETSITVPVFALAVGHGLAIYVTIFVHELGHVYAAKKRDYEVQGIVMHLFGGHTSFLGKYRKPSDQFWTAISGPIATLFVSIFAYFLTNNTEGLISSVSSWLLWSSLAITLVNLLPGVPLDGGGVLASLVWKLTGKPEKGQLVAGYGGYFVAALWLVSPFLYQYFLGWEVTELDIFFSAMIGVWLFTAARVNIKMAKADKTPRLDFETFHSLTVKDLARRSVAVDESLTLDQALEEMRKAEAGSVLVKSKDEVIGIVHEKFLIPTPDFDTDKPVTQFATRTNPIGWINFNEVIAHNPKIDPNFLHGQWVAIDEAGAIFGVLHRSDIAARLEKP